MGFLDRFYMNRISLRMLMHQHILLFEPDADTQTNRIGMLDPKCKVKSVIMEAFGNAAYLCEDYYDRAPEINIKGERQIERVCFLSDRKVSFSKSFFSSKGSTK